MYRKFFKRLFDIVLSFIALVIIAPFLLIFALLIKIDSRGPIIFSQKRLGLRGKEFNIHKFRTMIVGAEKIGSGVYSGKGDKRVTRIGKFLRATSIDELPQLWDILVGRMSFIGPRPPLTYHPWTFDKYTEEQKKMFLVRPGITGWAQINGRKEVEWHRRIEYSVWYVEHLSFWLDIKIFFLTIWKVLTNANNVNTGVTVKKDDNIPSKKNLELMYITNDPKIAQIAENAGVERIFIDMEYIGKELRQGGLDTIQNHHTIDDVNAIANSVKKSKVLVRINPIHQATQEYSSSKEEIDAAIEGGADILMLPYFKTVDEVQTFIDLVQGRTKTLLLLETIEAVDVLDQILIIKGIDEIHIGINDLSLALGKKFMFELVADGTVEKIINKIKPTGIPYGFGGTARLHKGILPAEFVLAEHHRLGSSMVILSRTFCDTSKTSNYEEIEKIFVEGIKEIRDYENELSNDEQFYKNNSKKIADCVNEFLTTQREGSN